MIDNWRKWSLCCCFFQSGELDIDVSVVMSARLQKVCGLCTQTT
jgi:hypothetical protein